jgi:hypothetical protein
VCGFGDPSRDQLDDDRVTVSNLFHISQGSFSIIAPYSDRMRTLADQLRTAAAAIPGGIHAQIWHVAVLLPSNVQSTQVHKLSDVLDLKGKILTPELFR